MTKFSFFNFSYKQKNFNHGKKFNFLKEKPVIQQNKKDENAKKNAFQGQKLNITYENIRNILINLSKENNYNYNNLPKDDISHEEFFEVNKIENQAENKIIKYDTSKIYNETILSYLIENLPNIKEKETLTLSNLTSLIEIINEKQIGNLEIFDKLIAFNEKKLIEHVKTKYQNNSSSISKKEKEVLANEIFPFFKIHSHLGKANLELLNIFLEIYVGSLNLNQIQFNAQLEKERLNSYMNDLFNILWLISIAISNICEISNKNNNTCSNCANTNPNLSNKGSISYTPSNPSKTLYLETYDKTIEKDLLLSEKAVVNLVNLLKFISKNLDFDNSFSLEMDQKIRLYKSLLYFKLEGIVLNENLDNFVKKFKNFHLLNVQNMTTESLMEKKFEEILKKFKVVYEKEKKTDFCSADFFIKPNIIIEINGPDHYSFGALKGKDNLKKRALKFLGFKILNVSFKEFNNLNELENKIKNILKIDLKKIIINK